MNDKFYWLRKHPKEDQPKVWANKSFKSEKSAMDHLDKHSGEEGLGNEFVLVKGLSRFVNTSKIKEIKL